MDKNNKFYLIGTGAIIIIIMTMTDVKNYFAKLITGEAEKWLGVKELGNNKSFQNEAFEKMLKEVGWKSG